MRYFILIFVLWIMACSSSKNLPGTKRTLNKVYESQQQYYTSVLDKSPDYKSILNYSSKGRSILYKKHSVNLAAENEFTILEGYSPGWGSYIGFLMTDKKVWYYSNRDSASNFKEIMIDSPKLENEIGVPPAILKTVRAWDTAYISGLKSRIGSHVLDGYFFWAVKVQRSGKILDIANYTFREYPVK